jgi:hypothetical protein
MKTEDIFNFPIEHFHRKELQDGTIEEDFIAIKTQELIIIVREALTNWVRK